MNRRAATFLYVFAGWTVFVWVVFIKNIAWSHQFSSGFKAIHITLAVISIAFGAVCFYVVTRVRRAASTNPTTPPVSPAAAPATSATREASKA